MGDRLEDFSQIYGIELIINKWQKKDFDTDLKTVESEPDTQDISSTESSTDPASIKDFFQTLWTRADNHVTLEKKKEIETEVGKENEIIIEENLVDNKEPKILLETDLDELEEEEAEVS